MYAILNSGNIRGYLWITYLLSAVLIYGYVSYFIPSIWVFEGSSIEYWISFLTFIGYVLIMIMEMRGRVKFNRNHNLDFGHGVSGVELKVMNEMIIKKMNKFSDLAYITSMIMCFAYVLLYLIGFNIWVYFGIGIIDSMIKGYFIIIAIKELYQNSSNIKIIDSKIFI